MTYIYKILVIDDQIQASTFDVYKKFLGRNDCHVEFTVINNEAEYVEQDPYDILMVDYDLRHGFYNNDKELGHEFIQSFRVKNSVSKVIYYSSEFEYDSEKRKYNVPFAHKDIFDLINTLRVDKIAAKDNFNMMIQVIKECCEQLDILPLLLSRTLSSYQKNNIQISYTNNDGEDIDVSTLLDELLNDTKQGKIFRQEIVETVLSVLFKYSY